MKTKMKTWITAMLMAVMILFALTPSTAHAFDPFNEEGNMYTIMFKNYDGETLQMREMVAGSYPKYDGETPTRPYDEENTYVFERWDPGLVVVKEPAMYYAVYTPVPKADPAFTVSAKDITYGNDATVTASLPDDATGSFQVTVKDPKGSERSKDAEVKNGQAAVIFPDLPEGTCAVTAVYSGDEKYKMVTKETSLFVDEPYIEEWTASDSLPTEPGNYRLTQNVDLGYKNWYVPAGRTSLFLNGKSITSSDDDDGTIVLDAEDDNKPRTLNILDDNTGDSAGKISSSESNGVFLKTGSTTFNLYGGRIEDCDDYGVETKESGACFNMYGGTISNCWTGVLVEDDSSFNMYNGKISHCNINGVWALTYNPEVTLYNGEITDNKLGIYLDNGTLRIENGSIKNNKQGVLTDADTTGIILQGRNIAPVIADNKDSDNKDNNLYLCRDKDLKIKVQDGTTFSDKARICLAATKDGVFTDGMNGYILGNKEPSNLFSSDDPTYSIESGFVLTDVEGGVWEASLRDKSERSPVGAVDSVKDNKDGSILVEGWAFDPSYPSATIEVRVYIGGIAGSSEAEDHSGIKTNISRPDVNAQYSCSGNHGFKAVIPTKKRGIQTVCLYGVSVEKGVSACIGSKTITITNPATKPASKKAIEKQVFPPIKIKGLKAGKKTVKVNWKKISNKNRKKIQGIEVQYSKDGFSTIAGTRYVKKTGKSVKIKGLKPGTKYRIRIRAYKSAPGGKLVSAWTVKSFKTK